MLKGGWSRCSICEDFVHYRCLASGKNFVSQTTPSCLPNLRYQTTSRFFRQNRVVGPLFRPKIMHNSELSASRSMGSNKLSTLFLYYVLSPLLCAFSGFHLTSYLLVGLYTWPRTSRTIVLTVGTLIFVYEFIFKSQAPQFVSGKIMVSRRMGSLYFDHPFCLWSRHLPGGRGIFKT